MGWKEFVMARLLALLVSVAVPLSSVSGLQIDGREIPLAGVGGTGDSVSYLLVDFGGAEPPGGSYLFSYHYDGAPTAAAMLQELSGATELMADMVDHGFGRFVTGLAVGADHDVPVFADDSRYWEYWLGDYDPNDGGRVTWNSAEFGISDRQLTPGSLDGWYASTGGIVPSFTLPEPAASASWVFMVVAAMARRRLA